MLASVSPLIQARVPAAATAGAAMRTEAEDADGDAASDGVAATGRRGSVVAAAAVVAPDTAAVAAAVAASSAVVCGCVTARLFRVTFAPRTTSLMLGTR